ncbi:hypothetical protein MMC07_004022 [Pseudocyphellaria aurata]|nr:hypothetical protein [Pseudocyphellaria aurata]
MAQPKLKLYVDIVSPYAYLAFHVVRRQTSPVFKDCDVTFGIVFLGGIMKACGNTPPINIKNKAQWSTRMRLHWARLFNVPMDEQLPERFPQNSVLTQRALCAITLKYPSKLERTIAALYYSSFVERKAIHDSNSLLSVLATILGESEAGEILGMSSTDEIKKLLLANTSEALAEGSFGLPWFVATNSEGQTEGFWGFDHLAQVTEHLGLQRPTPDTTGEEGWRALL